MRKEFEVHKLNEDGMLKAEGIAEQFETLLDVIEDEIKDQRCLALVKAKLEEACFFAKKGMAVALENQEK